MDDRKQPIQSPTGITIPEILQPYCGTGGGIESWLNARAPAEVLQRVLSTDSQPLSFEFLSQLLILSHEAGHSRGFFRYYWLSVPSASDPHPYNVAALSNYDQTFAESISQIVSLQHLAWGLERLYVDGLLFFGNVRECYRALRNKNFDELCAFFRSKCYDTSALKQRSAPLPLHAIVKDDRYLIAEMACKTYDAESLSELKTYMKNRLTTLKASGAQKITAREIFGLPKKGEQRTQTVSDPQLPLPMDHAEFSLDEILDSELQDSSQLDAEITKLADRFQSARDNARKNTSLYLSMAYDLDVYVATSMRTRDDFRNMADRCSYVFGNADLQKYNLRYFDPTMSAADSHEDKGLIECLMVKCAKILIYTAGTKDSYGKDAEAAMALSL